MEEQVNTISQEPQKKNKIFKKIVVLAMACCILLTSFTIGCNNSTNNTPADDKDSPTTAKYSQLLQNILDSDYCNTLITQVWTWGDKGYFDPHPYGFLEKEGYNINLIKSNNLLCNTYAYVLDKEPNNLYMAVSVETKSTQPYFTEYLLKYTLTDKEMSDYDMLHSEEIIQAMFMNDEISKNKEVEIINKAKCTVEAHEGIKTTLKSIYQEPECLNGNDVYGILFKEYNLSEKRFYAYIYSSHYSSFLQRKMKSKQAIALIPMFAGSTKIEITTDGAFNAPCHRSQFGFHKDDRITFQETITCYNTQDIIASQTDIDFNKK